MRAGGHAELLRKDGFLMQTKLAILKAFLVAVLFSLQYSGSACFRVILWLKSLLFVRNSLFRLS
jgi:hypothetical protein